MPRVPKKWEDLQSEIHNLYIVKDQPLREVQRLMRLKGFDASERSYKSKLMEWGYMKYDVERRRESRMSSQHQPEMNIEMGNAAEPLPSVRVPNPAPGLQYNDILHAAEVFDSAEGIHSHTELPSIVSSLDFRSFSMLPPPTSPNSGNPNTWSFTPNTSHSSSSGYYIPYSSSNSYDSSIVPPILGNQNSLVASQAYSNPNIPDVNGKTSLHHAVIRGSFKDVERYLYAGATIDIQDKTGDQAIHYAVTGGFTEILRALLKKGADVEAKGHMGRSPLHLASRSPMSARILLKWHATVSIQDNAGDTPLHLALAASSMNKPSKCSTITVLIKSGADVNMRNNARISPFHMILDKRCSTGTEHSFYLLMFLENRADIFMETVDGETPFEAFFRNTNYSWRTLSSQGNLAFKLFLSKGANINIGLESGETLANEVLKSAGYGTDKELVKLICEHADVNKAGLDGNCPLHWLLLRSSFFDGTQHLDHIKDFLRRGANVNQPNGLGQTPLIVNVIEDSDDIVRIMHMLLEGGADPMQRDTSGDMPIHIAVQRRRGSWHYQRNKDKKLIGVLLDASFWMDMQDHLTPRERNRVNEDSWWQDYRRLYLQGSWSYPDFLAAHTQFLPEDIAEELSKLAFSALAEKYLELVKTGLNELRETDMIFSREQGHLRKTLVGILRDCKTLKIDLGSTWYDLLLELQD